MKKFHVKMKKFHKKIYLKKKPIFLRFLWKKREKPIFAKNFTQRKTC